MKNRCTAIVLIGALAMVGLTPVHSVAGQAGTKPAPGQNTPKEPLATPEEFKARVIRQTDLPVV